MHQIKDKDILAKLFVNSDQTNISYTLGDNMTWVQKGSQQVTVMGSEGSGVVTVYGSGGMSLIINGVE